MLESTSFTPLGTISPQVPALLLGGACNPVMDLVALITSPKHLPAAAKGKARAGDDRKVSLWRMSGTKVWEVGYDGVIAGLAWSPDGLYLTLFTYTAAVTEAPADSVKWTLSHVSVYDGTTAHASPYTPGEIEPSWKAVRDGGAFWDLEWTTSAAPWPIPEKGCNRMIIDLLPNVVPVEPPKPTNPLMFNLMQQANKNKPKGPIRHSALSTFPTLLPSFAQTNPQILHVTPPRASSSKQLLSGIYPISDVPQQQSFIMAGIAHRMSEYLDAVLRGLENAQAAQKEGAKQTMIWREELETCGEQQGMSAKDVFDDLFRFLMTGRSTPAVAEWLGNRLTGRVISKWESTLDQSCKDIHAVLVDSVQPALERIILLLDDVKALSHMPEWKTDVEVVQRALTIARGLLLLLERIRRLTKLQSQASAEWFRWLQYEISRTSTTDPSHDNIPTATYDVKLVWSFMRSGFVDPPLQSHLPNLPLVVDLPETAFQVVPSQSLDLGTTLKSSLDKLSKLKRSASPAEPLDPPSPAIVDDSMDSSRMQEDEENFPPVRSRSSSIESDATVPIAVKEEEPVRRPELEPLVWANVLTRNCLRLFVNEGKPTQITSVVARNPGGSGIFAKRQVEDFTWVGYTQPDTAEQLLWFARIGDDQHVMFSALKVEAGMRITALDFFDDTQLVLVVEQEGQAYLTTVLYQEIADALRKPSSHVPSDWTIAGLSELATVEVFETMHIARSRPLGVAASTIAPSLAMNGRQGRRVACVSMRGGAEVLVFDMEEDEDAEEEEEPDDDQEMMDD